MLHINVNDKHRYQLAENWNEIPGNILLRIAPLLLKAELTLEERTHIAMMLLGAPLKWKGNPETVDWDYLATQVEQLILPEINYLFEGNRLTRQKLPVVQLPIMAAVIYRTCKLYGPTDNFDTLTLAEFSDLETCLNQYDATQQEIWFNRFIGILYRRKKSAELIRAVDFDGDIRQPYNINLNEEYAGMAAMFTLAQKSLILLWYYGCRQALAESNKALFAKGSAKESSSWTDVIHLLSGPKFGNLEETGKVRLKVIFKELQLLLKAAAENSMA